MVEITEARFALALALTMAASIYKSRSTKANVLVAAAILYMAFGLRNTGYLGLSVLLNLALMMGRANQYVVTAVNILNIYIYKAVGHCLEPRIKGTFDIAGFLMVLTLKMGYLARDYDGSLWNALDYIFFIPGLLTGPTAPYKSFIEKDRTARVDFPTIPFLRTIAYLCTHLALRSFPFKDGILSHKRSLATRLICLYLFNLSNRMRFHFAWNFAHCCFILTNLPEFLNIDFAKVEFTESVREISSHWNKFVSVWLKEMFFLPLRRRSVSQTALITHMVSAVLHGFNLCYLVFTLSFCIYSHSITRANEVIRYRPLKIIQMIGFVSYFSMPFYLLSLRELYMVWKSVYFYGHIYCTFWLVYFSILGRLRPAQPNKSD